MKLLDRTYVWALPVVLCLPALSLPDGGGIMTGLGTLGFASSHAHGVSDDGEIVVGYALAGYTTLGYPYDHAFRWTATEGMVDLDPGTETFSQAGGISGDGSTIVGYGAALGAFRWTEAEGLQPLSTEFYSYATAANADGSVIVGNIDPTNLNQARQPFRWTAAEGIGLLGTLGGPATSSATDVSADGSVVVGLADSPSGYRAFRWTFAGGMQSLGTLGGNYSAAYGISSDGSVVVGTSQTSNGEFHAFRWTTTTGMQDLGAFGPHWAGQTLSTAYAVSADGSVVAGSSSDPDNPGGSAFRWAEACGLQHLGTLGNDNYGSSAAAITDDASVIVGTMGLAFRWDATPYAAPWHEWRRR